MSESTETCGEMFGVCMLRTELGRRRHRLIAARQEVEVDYLFSATLTMLEGPFENFL